MSSNILRDDVENVLDKNMGEVINAIEEET